MGRKRSQKRSQGELEASAGEMHARLWSWRREKPEASFDEIMERVRQEREAMMRPLVEELVSEAGEIATQALGPNSSEASAWVQAQKAALARSQLRLFFSRILRLYPNPEEAPPEVKQAVNYLWKNRQRMKQAGMRWSRDGAQAMLALRARLLSDRWHEIPI